MASIWAIWSCHRVAFVTCLIIVGIKTSLLIADEPKVVDEPKKAARLARAVALAEPKTAKVYEKGCSEFISEVLQLTPPKSAEQLIGNDDVAVISEKGKFTNLTPGDIVGIREDKGTDWHVAIYVGDYANGVVFIDVRGPKSDKRPEPKPLPRKSFGKLDSVLRKTSL